MFGIRPKAVKPRISGLILFECTAAGFPVGKRRLGKPHSRGEGAKSRIRYYILTTEQPTRATDRFPERCTSGHDGTRSSKAGSRGLLHSDPRHQSSQQPLLLRPLSCTNSSPPNRTPLIRTLPSSTLCSTTSNTTRRPRDRELPCMCGRIMKSSIDSSSRPKD